MTTVHATSMRRMAGKGELLMARVTLVALAVYFPLETYVTWSIAGLSGFLYSSYLANVLGMALMLWAATAARRGRPEGPGLLAAGWSWTAATFWRATSDRYWLSSLGMPLYAGPVELWLAPIVTSIAVAAVVASLVLLVKSPETSDK